MILYINTASVWANTSTTQKTKVVAQSPASELREQSTGRQKMDERLATLGLKLAIPSSTGNKVLYKRVGNLIYINQLPLRNGVVLHPGAIGANISDDDARAATRLAMSNILAILQQAAQGDLSRVKQAVQLTVFFTTSAGFTDHASIMKAASDMVLNVFGEAGRPTEATVGAISLPMNSPVEIQAIFELFPSTGNQNSK